VGPNEIYDDLEPSIFKIMFTCGTKVGLRHYCEACVVNKQEWNSKQSAAVATVVTEVFLSLNLLRSEIL
jgi:hypothetical protein